MVPKHNSRDAGSAFKPTKSYVLSTSEKVKILDMIEIEKKNHMQRLPSCMARMNLPFVK